MAARRALLLGLLLLSCDGDGPASGRVEGPGGESFRIGEPHVVEIGDRTSFEHRYRFRAERGRAVPISAEAGGVMLEIRIAREGERPQWKEGPKPEVSHILSPPETGVYEVEVRGEALTYGNSYRLVIGHRAR